MEEGRKDNIAEEVSEATADVESIEDIVEDFGEEQAVQKTYATDGERIVHTVIERAEGVSLARFAGSEEEKRTARELRDLFIEELDKPAHMEPFDVHPLSGRQGLPVYGLIYAVCLIAFLALPPLGMVLTALLGVLVIEQIYLNGNLFGVLFPKKTSYNVVSIVEKDKRRTEKTIVIGSHYDSDYGRPAVIRGFTPDDVNKKYRNLFLTIVAASILLLFMLSAVRTAFPKILALNIILCFIGFIASGLSIAYLCTSSSYLKSGACKSKTGLSGAGVALAVGKHFVDHPEELPENVRLIIAAFGSKNAGGKGSEQFVKTHWGRDDLLVNPVIINLDKLYSGDYQVITKDKLLKVTYDEELADAVFATLEQGGYNPQRVEVEHKTNDAVAFERAGLPVVTIRRQTAKNERKRTEAEDLDEALSAVLSVVKALL